ncbi:MAG: hypothetical protein HUK25_08380 [Treponema sp.]|nr:hypothetical protein [Treponema sp.]
MKAKINPKIKHIIIVILESLTLTGLILFSVFPFSCRVTASGIEIIGADYKVPVLEEIIVESDKTIRLRFSDEVLLLNGIISPYVEGISDSETVSLDENLSTALESALGKENKIPVSIESNNEKSEIIIKLEESTEIGKKYEFYGEVENKKGSSLLFSFFFTGYNSRVPALVFTEIKDAVSEKYGKEFVELYALSDGNLAGLKISSTNDGENNAFIFPAIEISKGDFITVHYRKPQDSSGCISELSGDKTLSTGSGSSDIAWDIWVENSDSRLGASQDVIVLENPNTGKILQSVIYSIDKKNEWMKEKFQEKAQFCSDTGAWSPDGSFENAVIFKTSCVLARTNLSEIIENYEHGYYENIIPSNAKEWIRITESSVSPGRPNPQK